MTEGQVAAIVDAAESGDAERMRHVIGVLLDQLRAAGSRLDPARIAGMLEFLRRHRRFDEMQRLADGLIRCDYDTPVVYRQYAQALIDGGLLVAAEEVLRAALTRVDYGTPESAEIHGLIGRLHKQKFVDACGRQSEAAAVALKQAFAAYWGIYNDNRRDHFWHGINAVALLKRAERDGITPRPAVDAGAIAADILAQVGESAESGGAAPWEFATAAEACLALDRLTDAEEWIGRYIGDSTTTPFAIAGTLRQFEEIWRLADIGAESLLVTLRAALLRAPGGNPLTLSPSQVLQGNTAGLQDFQRVFGSAGTQTYNWMLHGMARARAVGMVRRGVGHAVGTGFLVRARDIGYSDSDELLFLTNAHVVSNRELDCSLPPLEARVHFTVREEETGRQQAHRVELLWSSPRENLDASLLRLDPPVTGIVPCPLAPGLPTPGNGARVYVIGHPRGAELSFSLQDNTLLDHDGPARGQMFDSSLRRLHYTTPTEKGNSGSPVFDEANWEVIGLHRRGSDTMRRLRDSASTYAANEAVCVQSIAAAIREAGRG